MSEQDSSWIVKGAKVVRLCGHRGNEAKSITHDVVAKVNKVTFVLESGMKCSLGGVLGPSEQRADRWSTGAEIVRPDDPRIAVVSAQIKLSSAKLELHSAWDKVRRDTTRETLDELRSETNKVDQALEYLRLAQERAADAKAGA